MEEEYWFLSWHTHIPSEEVGVINKKYTTKEEAIRDGVHYLMLYPWVESFKVNRSRKQECDQCRLFHEIERCK